MENVMGKLEEKLSAPSSEYRSVPFWSWNDELDLNELQWQIHEMKEKGIGGFFMHARGGLKTPYMSEKWMKCVKACIEEAKQLDMEAWLYDEEGWPSGFAGGAVPALGEYYYMRWMECEKVRGYEIRPDEMILGIYDESAHFLGNKIEKIKTEDAWVYVIKEKMNPYYVDVLNSKVVKKFLEFTHEVYKKELGEEFGRNMPGFFTDEPQFAKLKIPYSLILPEYFKKVNGYELTDALLSLFEDTPDAGIHRYNFWKVISELYTNGYMKTVGQWCKENGCKLTGHVMREDSLLLQMQATAGVMPSYEYMDMPGIDWLRRRISSPLTPKQVGSVAAQLGKKHVITESFAMTGWDCSPEELKWITQWQYVNGVNRMCQHLQSYSIRGCRKRDFPPSLFYQQSWWEEYKIFCDYIARLGVLLTEGFSAAEVLLLHPMHSAWMLYDGKEEGPVVEFGNKFESLSQTLSDYHIEHHYGDEDIIKKYGKTGNGKFIVGQCEYRTVILPDMLCIEDSTVKLLLQFVENGGHVFSVGSFPKYMQGGKNSLLDELYQKIEKIDVVSLKEKLWKILEFPISVTENGSEVVNIHYQLRKCGEMKILYLVNLNRNGNYSILLQCPGENEITEYKVEEDAKQKCCCVYGDKVTKLQIKMNEMEGKVFFIKERENKKDEDLEDNKEIYREKETIVLEQGGSWKLDWADWNSYTLDRCSYRIGDGEWKDEVNTIQIMEILLKQKRPVNVSLKYKFVIETEPQLLEEMFLAAETGKELRAEINGVKLELEECGWWKDKSFRKYRILPYIRRGSNEIILNIDFYQSKKVYDVLFGENVLETEINKLTYNTEIESVYLIGKFGVYNRNGFTYAWRKGLSCDSQFVIRQLPDTLYGDDFTSQGFCFFAGRLRIKQNIFICPWDDSRGVKIEKIAGKRYIYRFNRPNAMAAILYINGKLVKQFMWAPFECDVTDYLKDGVNEFMWELFASNRNLLGPHHHIDGELYAVWPASFTDTPTVFLADDRNVWSDLYHFVKFGM